MLECHPTDTQPIPSHHFPAIILKRLENYEVKKIMCINLFTRMATFISDLSEHYIIGLLNLKIVLHKFNKCNRG